MSHLEYKRFDDKDPKLTAGARRNRAQNPHVSLVELDPSGRAQCKSCGERLVKGQIRHVLMLECHKGYRNACTLHVECFWRHPQVVERLKSLEELHIDSAVSPEQVDALHKRFAQEIAKRDKNGDVKVKIERTSS